MLEFKCDICKNPITESAALMVSPPDINSMVFKHHICRDCYYGFMEVLQEAELLKE